MAVTVTTDTPTELLSAIKKAIDDNRITTWSYDEDGDFTHTAEQWRNKAWLRPTVGESRLILNIIPPHSKTISVSTYGIYHGRFIEMLLNHFDGKFSQAVATATPIRGDRVKGSAA